MTRTAVIIAAAGRSVRIGLKTPKPFIHLSGAPLLARTIALFERHRRIGAIQPVIPLTHVPYFTSRLLRTYRWKKCLPPVAGGNERQDSVVRGLESLPENVDIVMIHDAARPFTPSALISAVLDAAARHGAALAAVQVQDTVKKASPSGSVEHTVDRRGLWLAQTPQAFRADLLREAHRHAAETGFRGTDDASLVERLNHPVRLVPGSPLNLKITTREDLALARSIAGRGRAKSLQIT